MKTFIIDKNKDDGLSYNGIQAYYFSNTLDDFSIKLKQHNDTQNSFFTFSATIAKILQVDNV